MSTADWWRLLFRPLGRGLCWCAPRPSTNHQPFPFLWPLMCYASDISPVLKSQKGTKLLKTVHFWRTFKGFHFVIPFSIKNVCSLDHKALYMCLKQNCAQPFRDPPLWFEWKELIKGQKTQYGACLCKFALKSRQRSTWSDYHTKDAFRENYQ